MAMSRRKIRENLYIMLFRLEFYDTEDEISQQAEMFLEDEIKGATDKDREELRRKFYCALKNLDAIDSVIASKAKGWTIDRIAKSELAILRLAVYEILYSDVPTGVAINEAVELSKIYCADGAYRFINGVLAAAARDRAGAE